MSFNRTSAFAVSAYHHYRCEFEPRSGDVYSIQRDVIKFVNESGDFLRVLWISLTNKTDRHDITKILLKVALNTINQNQNG
jgi:hypothetical protein